MDGIKSALLNKIQASGRINEITYKLKVLDTDELRVVTILRIMEMFETTPQAKCKTKNPKDSIDLRNRANRLFASSKNDASVLAKTWELYSKSIAAARRDSPELALAYANRSAFLLKLRKYHECAQDIERALRLEYPDHLRGKLLCRKIECLTALSGSSSDDTVDELRKWLEHANLADSDKRAFEEKLKSFDNSNNVRRELTTRRDNVPTIDIPNELVPCASEAVAVKTNEEFGRHVVATRDIHPGEILVFEKPYSRILWPDEAHTHCSHCLQACWAMTPCEHCVYAMYCSEECRRQAWTEYHDVECGITGYLLDLGFNKHGLFATRLAIVAVRDAGSVGSLRERLRGEAGYSDGKLYLSDSYVNLYNLVTCSEKWPVSDLFDRSLYAAFVLYYLCTVTSFLGRKFNGHVKDLYEDEDATFVGGLILRHMQIIACNIHSYEEEREMDIVDIGAMALPFCSLINHSCDPNVSRCATQRHMIVFALGPIKRGSQIYDSYGSHYAVMSRAERKAKLKQYYFDCRCEPCKSDWPVYQSLPVYTELLKERETIRIIEKALEKLDNYVQCAKEDRIDDKLGMISELGKMINTLVEHLPLPCADVNKAVETLKRVFTLTYGNKFEIPKL